ncbi:dipeptidase PepV [Vagococcus intermedius]|uniref:Dipeptidase PepV n=1 Tax=Vagococcus intermedius TaxID=2991418 RepID=A0AAF0CUN3_9ENTE|nr:dipeptidase PepV [Vagococcus intermedius]WEG73042.1 dipeptidase PepV [Vagococcus intermedius]WEG75127.1 dipeptidase PepV [Vagococcus intermedius]
MTTIDWQKEVDSRKSDLMEDLKTLIRIDSVKDMENATEEFPVGKGPAMALHKALEFGERDGFVTKNIENMAGHIEYGEGDETFGILGHVDVVPVGDGWNTDPFEPTIIDGKLYARGSSDDKGPMMAAYYALKIIKELELPVSKKVRFIIGTDEESGWACMDRYMANETMPDFGFSPDAMFPIINGEKGIASYTLEFNNDASEGDVTLNTFTAGIASNMVPGDATVEMTTGLNTDEMKAALESYVAENGVRADFTANGETVTIKLYGKQCHAQTPTDGVNAATHLANFLSAYKFDGQGQAYIQATAKFLHADPQGNLTGVAHKDDIMGELTSSANIFRYTKEGDKTISINIRYPKGTDSAKIAEQMQAVIVDAKVIVEAGVKEPHYTSKEDPMVKTFLETYEKYTGLEGFEQTIGGGTYGRLFERGCAFGALFPGRENVMHQANEYMVEEDIYRAAVIYADSIYQLIK